MNQALYQLRQLAAELLACAVCDLFPGAHLVEAVVSEFGFQCDFIAKQPIDAYAIPLIEEKMRALSKADMEVRALAMMRENAADLLQHHGQPIRADIVAESSENIVSVCQIGEFFDYCPALSMEKTSEVRSFKILKIEKALYHREEWENLPVVRIRGTAFEDLKSLKKFVRAVEASKKRDHRILVKEMMLCSQNEEVGGHQWFWLPRGVVLRDTLRHWWLEEHKQCGFQPIATPSFVKATLLKKIGLANSAYAPAVFLKNCEYTALNSRAPLHALHFKAGLHSYRELPARYVESAQVYDYKKDGELWGLFNASFVEEDLAHVFCAKEQVEQEMISSLQFIDKITKILGFEHYWCLGGRGQKSAGTPRQWESITACLHNAFKACGLSCFYDKETPVFAGPAAQAYLVDSLGREWKGPRMAVDFNYPERLGLRYQAQSGNMEVPVMLTRTLFGSLERFIALLIEHFAGALPLWLAPEQVRVISVGENSVVHAKKTWQALNARGFRVGADYRPDQLGKKIHQAEEIKVPYLVIIGDKEEKKNLLTVRSGCSDKIQAGVTCEIFFSQIEEEMKTKSLPKNTGSTKYGRKESA